MNEDNLMWLLMQVMFKAKRSINKQAEAHDLTFMQATALHLLHQPEPQPMKMLSDCLMCDASTITGLVDRLEARGLILRQNHPSDRRVKLLALTKQGVKLQADIMHKAMTAESAKLEALLNEPDLAQFRQTLQRLLVTP